MCGIFGIVSKHNVKKNELTLLAEHARQRGRDSSGLILNSTGNYNIYRADFDIKKLLSGVKVTDSPIALGHSRLITNGLSDNQPVIRGDICVIHNGIIVNYESLWEELQLERRQEIDTEIIAAIAEQHVNNTGSLAGLSSKVLSLCDGVVATAIISASLGEMILFSNNGSLYIGKKDDVFYFSSEQYPLTKLGCVGIEQIINDEVLLDIPEEK